MERPEDQKKKRALSSYTEKPWTRSKNKPEPSVIGPQEDQQRLAEGLLSPKNPRNLNISERS